MTPADTVLAQGTFLYRGAGHCAVAAADAGSGPARFHTLRVRAVGLPPAKSIDDIGRDRLI